jgi:hypothetical protein
MKQLSRKILHAAITKIAIALVGLAFVVGLAMYVSWLMKDNQVSIGHTDHIGITSVQVDKIKSIGQWEFLSIADEELVDTVRHGFFGDSELARIYYGTLRLGIDMRQVKEGWILMDHDTVVATLPAIQLLDDKFLDEARTKTFYEDGKWTENDKEALRHRACEAMKRRCLTADNVSHAQQNAKKQFESLLKAMDFPFIKVRFQE